MRIAILSIGKGKPGPEADLYAQYVKRLPWKVTLIEKKELSALQGERKKSEEGALLLTAAGKQERKVALDERGKSLSSQAFAKQLGGWADQGVRDIAFFIGGSDGLGDEVRDASDFVLSLGALTWPHYLVRALLAEQLYRAHTILTGHPYHRE